MSKAETKVSNDVGNFFAVDRRTWRYACLRGINPAVVYLVLARGSDRHQRSTSWSVNAVEKYTKISRDRAAKAITDLERVGLLVVLQRGTKPRYQISPAYEVADCEGYQPDAKEIKEWEKWIDEDPFFEGPVPSATRTRWRELENRLMSRGAVRSGPTGGLALPPEEQKPDWIWLPNSLVDGVGDNRFGSVEQVRQLRSIDALRLLVDLYHAHSLAGDGGVHWQILGQKYTRQNLWAEGPWVIYGFDQPGPMTCTSSFLFGADLPEDMKSIDGREQDISSTAFWAAWRVLVDLGLVQVVAHLIDDDTAEAEIIHPYAIKCGEVAERAVAAAAADAAKRLLPSSVRQAALTDKLNLVPVGARITKLEMVGIPRLRYPPLTATTAAWSSRMPEWREKIAEYNAL